MFEVQFRKQLRSGSGRHQRFFALDIAFSTQAQRTVIYGPSGAGKSLTLQAIAGLLVPDSGRIALQGHTLFDSAADIHLAPQERHLGYVFQDYALFPRLNVRQNIAFGLQRGLRNPERETHGPTVEHWLHTFELQDCAHQYPHQLSGGQRQRTALARALAPQPRALLLDEPFAALDPALRERLRDELAALLDQIRIPVLMITHDPQDIPRFGQETWLLQEGRIAPTTAASV